MQQIVMVLAHHAWKRLGGIGKTLFQIWKNSTGHVAMTANAVCRLIDGGHVLHYYCSGY